MTTINSGAYSNQEIGADQVGITKSKWYNFDAEYTNSAGSVSSLEEGHPGLREAQRDEKNHNQRFTGWKEIGDGVQ